MSRTARKRCHLARLNTTSVVPPPVDATGLVTLSSAPDTVTQTRKPIELVLGPAVVDRHVLALDVPRLPQALAKCAHAVREAFRRDCVEEADPPVSPPAAPVLSSATPPRHRAA